MWHKDTKKMMKYENLFVILQKIFIVLGKIDRKALPKIDKNDLTIDTSVDFASMGGTFISGLGDFVTLFEPSATKVKPSNFQDTQIGF